MQVRGGAGWGPRGGEQHLESGEVHGEGASAMTSGQRTKPHPSTHTSATTRLQQGHDRVAPVGLLKPQLHVGIDSRSPVAAVAVVSGSGRQCQQAVPATSRACDGGLRGACPLSPPPPPPTCSRTPLTVKPPTISAAAPGPPPPPPPPSNPHPPPPHLHTHLKRQSNMTRWPGTAS